MLQENFNRIRFQVAQIALVSGTNVLAYNYITRCPREPLQTPLLVSSRDTGDMFPNYWYYREFETCS